MADSHDNSHLVVGIGAHVQTPADLQLLHSCIRSVRRFEPRAALMLVDNDSHEPLSKQLSHDDGITISRLSPSAWDFGALNASIEFALAQGATRYVYLQHSMELL